MYCAEGGKKEEGRPKKKKRKKEKGRSIGKEYVESYGNGPVLGKKGETYWITG